MRILICEPRKHPRVIEIPHTLKAMQDVVGGTIQAIYPWDAPAALVCDDDGRLKGYPFNRLIPPGYVIAGTFFVCGVKGEEFTDLSPELMRRFASELFTPHVLFRIGDSSIVLPMEVCDE